MLAPNTIPLPSKGTVTRKETRGTLLFQVETDEMYFLPEKAFSFFRLCDGTRTVEQIEQLLAHYQPEFATEEGREQIEHFLEELAARGLVELWR